MKVGADSICLNGALGPVLTIVPVSAHHPRKRPSTGTNEGPTTVVLKTNHGPWATDRRTNPVDHYVSNAPADRQARMDGMHVEYPQTREPGSGSWVIVMPEQLVATTHRQNRHTVVHRTAQPVGLDPEQIVTEELLIPILTTTHEQEVKLATADPVTYPNGHDLDRNMSPFASSGQHKDVAPVGIEVQQISIQVTDANLGPGG